MGPSCAVAVREWRVEATESKDVKLQVETKRKRNTCSMTIVMQDKVMHVQRLPHIPIICIDLGTYMLEYAVFELAWVICRAGYW